MNIRTCYTILSVLAALTVICHALQCNHRVQNSKSFSGNLTIPLNDVGQTCLYVSPPESKNKYILLKLTPSVAVSIDGETFESGDSLHQHCFIMTPFKRCPSLYEERVKKICPGGATATPICGPTTVYIKTNIESSQDGSNATTVEYKLVHRFYGLFDAKCTDLHSCASVTVAPATVTTAPDPTAAVTSLITIEDTANELSTTEDTDVPTTSTEPALTTATTTQSSSETTYVGNSTGPTICIPLIIGTVIVLGIIAFLLYYFCRKKNHRGHQKEATTRYLFGKILMESRKTT